MSDHHGLTKNMYRIVTENNQQYLEVQLQNDLIMKCELEHLHLIEERIWTGNKAKNKYTYYAKSRESKKRNQAHALFHRLAYPDFVQVDHINRNGLDNRICNVREGSGRVNPNNKRMQTNNKSGVKGVYRENGIKQRWCAQWNNIDGKKCRKGFGIKTYGEEQAFQLACQYREEQQNLANKVVFLPIPPNRYTVIKVGNEYHYSPIVITTRIILID